MTRKKRQQEAASEAEVVTALAEALADDGAGYDAADNSARSYTEAIAAIRMAGVKAGRFLPLPDRPDEIRASPLVEDVRQIGPATLYLGDSTRIVPLLAEQSAWIDACVTDPPYELGFMGKGWDSSGVAAAWETWGGVRIALKPGAHLVAFAGSRTYHRIAKAIDDAGFEVRDQLMWIYGSGFPKSLDVSKAIDKRRDDQGEILRVTTFVAHAAERANITRAQVDEHMGTSDMAGWWLSRLKHRCQCPTWDQWLRLKDFLSLGDDLDAEVWRLNGRKGMPGEAWNKREFYVEPTGGLHGGSGYTVGKFTGRQAKSGGVLSDAVSWEGWGTALKPSHEPVVFARKPLSEGTVAANVLRWATGAINVDGARVQGEQEPNEAGRWPANVVHDGSLEVLEAFPPSARDAIRFFYAAKAGREEREEGLSGFRAVAGAGVGALRDGTRTGSARANVHPTVKPVDLMRWLVRLVTPPAGVVLDPFMGSGTTGVAAVREGCRFIGVEQSPEYFEIAAARIAHAVRQAEREPDLVREITEVVRKVRGGGGQGDLF